MSVNRDNEANVWFCQDRPKKIRREVIPDEKIYPNVNFHGEWFRTICNTHNILTIVDVNKQNSPNTLVLLLTF